MDIIEVLGKLILLTKRNISLTQIGEALNIGRGGASNRATRRSEITPDEIEKIEDYFSKLCEMNISLSNIDSTISIPEQFKAKYNLSDEDQEFINILLINKTKRSMAKIFFSALDGNKDALEMIQLVISSPVLAEFAPSNPEGILNMGHKEEERQYKAAIEEAKQDN